MSDLCILSLILLVEKQRLIGRLALAQLYNPAAAVVDKGFTDQHQVCLDNQKCSTGFSSLPFVLH